MNWYTFTAYKLERGWNFSSKCARVILILMIIEILLSSLALGSAQWQHATSDIGSAYSGLWRVCILEKCDLFIHHSVYGWFHIVQASMVMSFLLHTVGSFLFLAQIFTKNQAEMPQKLFKPISLFSFIISVSLSFLSVLLYGINQGDDPSTLSWGYGCAVLNSILEFAIVMLFIINYSTESKHVKPKIIGSQEMVLLKYPRHLEDETVLFNREELSPEEIQIPEDNYSKETDIIGDDFTSNVDTSIKTSSRDRRITMTTARERSSTLDNSYNSCNFPS